MNAIEVHPLKPVFDANSRILILGSFPSVQSRARGFYYMHPQNRFWPVLSALLQEDMSGTIEEKTALLLKHHIALWDVIGSCSIVGSGDASIKNASPNDIEVILKAAPIRSVFLNGSTAAKLYQKHISASIPYHPLPSTSPANARFRLGDLVDAWRIILDL